MVFDLPRSTNIVGPWYGCVSFDEDSCAVCISPRLAAGRTRKKFQVVRSVHPRGVWYICGKCGRYGSRNVFRTGCGDFPPNKPCWTAHQPALPHHAPELAGASACALPRNVVGAAPHANGSYSTARKPTFLQDRIKKFDKITVRGCPHLCM